MPKWHPDLWIEDGYAKSRCVYCGHVEERVLLSQAMEWTEAHKASCAERLAAEGGV